MNKGKKVKKILLLLKLLILVLGLIVMSPDSNKKGDLVYHVIRIDETIPGTNWTLRVVKICDFHSQVYFENNDNRFNLYEIDTPSRMDNFKLTFADLYKDDRRLILERGVNTGSGRGYYFRIYEVSEEEITRIEPEFIYSCIDPKYDGDVLYFENYGTHCGFLDKRFGEKEEIYVDLSDDN